MKSKNDDKKIKLNQYRVLYNAGEERSVLDSYHYFTAETAEQALEYHYHMMKKHNYTSQVVSVDQKDPYAPMHTDPWFQVLKFNQEA